MIRRTRRKRKNVGAPARRPTRARLDALVEKATVDTYGDEEQLSGLFTMIEEHLVLPFDTEVLGVNVVVERVDLSASGEIVAVCRRGKHRQRISILYLPLPNPAPLGTEWIAAYQHWQKGRA